MNSPDAWSNNEIKLGLGGDGPWVQFSDYDALRQRLGEAEATVNYEREIFAAHWKQEFDRAELAEAKLALAEAECKTRREDYATLTAMWKDDAERLEAKLAQAEQLLIRCRAALKIGECDMHYHLPSGHRVSLLAQLEEATKETAK